MCYIPATEILEAMVKMEAEKDGHMLIEIPEKKNCAYCEFLDYEQGSCLLAAAREFEACASIWAHDGTKMSKDEECRPEWCPFKEESETSTNKLFDSVHNLSKELTEWRLTAARQSTLLERAQIRISELKDRLDNG